MRHGNNMDLGIKDKRVLVTGGSHGIGLAIKKALEAEGCIVRSISRREGCDVLNNEDIKRVLAEIDKSPLDILINNVGGGGRWGTESPVDTAQSVWEDVYQKNAGAAIKFTMFAVKKMLPLKWGRVVTISSIFGKEGGGRPWFNMAKAAEISLMKTLAIHYRNSGVTFNSVCPGLIAIPDTNNEIEGGKPEDVANVVTFLCSKQARWVNGACIVVDNAESRSF